MINFDDNGYQVTRKELIARIIADAKGEANYILIHDILVHDYNIVCKFDLMASFVKVLSSGGLVRSYLRNEEKFFHMTEEGWIYLNTCKENHANATFKYGKQIIRSNHSEVRHIMKDGKYIRRTK